MTRVYSNCMFHRNPNKWFKESIDPRDDCSVCQAVKDRLFSDNVSKKHVPGKWCKDHNVCSTCCSIKTLFRELKHYNGCCSAKKCPIRYNTKHVVYNETHVFKNLGHIKKAIVSLYDLMLNSDRKIYFWYTSDKYLPPSKK